MRAAALCKEMGQIDLTVKFPDFKAEPTDEQVEHDWQQFKNSRYVTNVCRFQMGRILLKKWHSVHSKAEFNQWILQLKRPGLSTGLAFNLVQYTCLCATLPTILVVDELGLPDTAGNFIDLLTKNDGEKFRELQEASVCPDFVFGGKSFKWEPIEPYFLIGSKTKSIPRWEKIPSILTKEEEEKAFKTGILGFLPSDEEGRSKIMKDLVPEIEVTDTDPTPSKTTSATDGAAQMDTEEDLLSYDPPVSDGAPSPASDGVSSAMENLKFTLKTGDDTPPEAMKNGKDPVTTSLKDLPRVGQHDTAQQQVLG